MMGQVVINDLALDGIQFNTPRKKSGAIKKKKNKTSKAGQDVSQKTSMGKAAATGIKNKIPSVDEILEKEPLLTLQR